LLLLSVNASVADSAVFVEGLNVRATVQLALAATLEAVEHVVILATIVKSLELGPGWIAGLLAKISAAVPVFITVTDICMLVEPCGTAPKASGLGGTGVRVTTGMGTAVPVPVSVTLCMLLATPLLLSRKLSEAVSPEVVEGLNETVTVQLEPAATDEAEEQVIPVMEKSAAFVPETPGLLAKLSGAPPMFISVTVC
jgi:hypothetical protein